MPTQLIRASAYVYDVQTSETKRTSLYYTFAEGIPFVDLFQVNAGNVLKVIHDTVGFAMRGVMSNTQTILKWTLRLWNGIDTMPVNVSPFEYTPTTNRDGVFDVPVVAFDAYGLLPALRVRAGSYGSTGLVGDAPRRARSIRFMLAREAVNARGMLLNEAIAPCGLLKDAVFKRLDVDEFPVLTLPGFEATPVRARFAYEDEALSADPDQTANDILKGFQPIDFTSFSSAVTPLKRQTAPSV